VLAARVDAAKVTRVVLLLVGAIVVVAPRGRIGDAQVGSPGQTKMWEDESEGTWQALDSKVSTMSSGHARKFPV
jgi:hypothetical protein